MKSIIISIIFLLNFFKVQAQTELKDEFIYFTKKIFQNTIADSILIIRNADSILIDRNFGHIDAQFFIATTPHFANSDRNFSAKFDSNEIVFMAAKYYFWYNIPTFMWYDVFTVKAKYAKIEYSIGSINNYLEKKPIYKGKIIFNRQKGIKEWEIKHNKFIKN
jgi:hypothetical protein